MKKSHLAQFILAFLFCLSVNVSAVTLDAIYTGSNGGGWNTASNWDISTVPVNQGAVTFNVTIPAGKQVVFDVPGDSEIDGLILGDSSSNDARLDLLDDCNLAVMVTADIYDFIYGQGGNFTSTVDTDSLDGTRNRIYAHNGSHIVVNDSDFVSSVLAGTYTILSVDGSGSVLDLSATTTLNDGFSAGLTQTHTIQAINGGDIDLSGLTSLIGPGDNDRLYINVNTGGSINLDNLIDISHAGTDGFTWFYLSNVTLSFPALTTLDYTSFSLDNSTINLPSLNTVKSTLFQLTNGSRANANTSPFTYSATGLNGTYTLLSADGTDSLLDLSAMTTLNDGFSAGLTETHTIQTINGGHIDLSGLTDLVGPGDNDRLYINVNTGGSINLNNLANISHAGTDGRVRFSVASEILDLPALSTVSSTEFYASNGGKIYANTSPFTYSATGLNGTYTLLSADGTDSLLDLSAMTTLNDGFSAGLTQTHTIQAINGGDIDLSGLTSLIGPGDNDKLCINVNTGGSIYMSSLATITGGTGKVYIAMNSWGELFLGYTVFGDDWTVTLDGCSYLSAKSVEATVPILATINDPNDMVEIVGDFDLTDQITLNGDGVAYTIVIGGNYSYTHTDETKVQTGSAILNMNGSGVQQLEVGGLDVDVLIGILTNDNFGFGQMVVGHCDQPTLVQLVEEIDNGNRASSNPEALYLFGLDDESDGLRILGGSILMIGDLNVYAMVNGTIERVRDWFDPCETVIAYDEGYIMLGNPEIDHAYNLIANGGFEIGINPPDEVSLYKTLANGSSDLTNWTIGGDGVDWCHDSLYGDPCEPGVLSVDLSGTPAGCGIISQDIPTQIGHRYFVWFNMSFNPVGNVYGQAGEKSVEVRAANDSKLFTIDSTIDPAEWPADPNFGWTVPWQTMTYSFIANDTTTTLEFACMDDPATAYGAAIDNVVVVEGGQPFSLIPGDLNFDHIVDIEDFEIFCLNWLMQNCNGLVDCWCDGTDLDKDGDVDIQDFAILAANWLGSWQTANYSLSISSTIGGSVTTPGEGYYSWDEATVVSVEAVADTHYEFTEWSGTAVDNGKVTDPCLASTDVNADGNYTLKANFHKVSYTLTTSSTNGGTVTVPGEGAFSYEAETLADVTAVPELHQHFVQWTGTAVTAGKVGSATSPSTTVLMDADYTLQAVFAVDTHTLDVSSSQGGQVSQPGEGVFSYDYDTIVTIEAANDTHYSFTEWTGTAVTAGKVANPTASQTTVTVDADYTLVANFEINQYDVTIDSTSGGSVTVPGEGVFSYEAEQQITLTAVAETHYHFIGWTGAAVTGGMVADPCLETTTLTVNENTSVTAEFEVDMLSLTIDSTGGGSVTDPGEGTFSYPYGDVISVIASPDSGYQFVQWTGTAVTAGKVADPCAASTTVSIEGVYDLTAEFEQKPIETVYDFALDSDPCWPMTGQWQYGIPTGNGGVYFGNPDPTSGNTGNSVIGVNLNGDYDLAVGGPYTLTAGPFDLSAYQDASLEFASWLNTDLPQYVKHMIEISTNGSNWSVVWEHTSPTDITDSSWNILEYDISAVADGQSTVYLRWSYEVLAERAYPYSGWNLDDIKLTGRQN